MLENKTLLDSVEFVSLSTIKLPGLLHLQGVTLPLKLLLVLWTEIALFSFVLAAIFDHQQGVVSSDWGGGCNDILWA